MQADPDFEGPAIGAEALEFGRAMDEKLISVCFDALAWQARHNSKRCRISPVLLMSPGLYLAIFR